MACRNRTSGRNSPTGRDHPNWRGGAAYYRGPKWRLIRDQVRDRDGWACRDCGRPRCEGKLDVHHVVPAGEWDRPGSANDLANLVTLCPGCHRRRHSLPVDEAAERRRIYQRRYYLAHRAEKLAYAKARQERMRAG